MQSLARGRFWTIAANFRLVESNKYSLIYRIYFVHTSATMCTLMDRKIVCSFWSEFVNSPLENSPLEQDEELNKLSSKITDKLFVYKCMQVKRVSGGEAHTHSWGAHATIRTRELIVHSPVGLHVSDELVIRVIAWII